MTEIIGPADAIVVAIKTALEEYERTHPDAVIHVRRQNSAAVRIRVIDRAFNGLDRIERESAVWPLLDKLADDARDDISMLLLLTPDEVKSPGNLVNLEFEYPLGSTL